MGKIENYDNIIHEERTEREREKARTSKTLTIEHFVKCKVFKAHTANQPQWKLKKIKEKDEIKEREHTHTHTKLNLLVCGSNRKHNAVAVTEHLPEKYKRMENYKHFGHKIIEKIEIKWDRLI
jgi:hypothetical protein